MTFNTYLQKVTGLTKEEIPKRLNGKYLTNKNTFKEGLDTTLLAYGIYGEEGLLGIYKGPRSLQCWLVTLPHNVELRATLGLIEAPSEKHEINVEKFNADKVLATLLTKKDMFSKVYLTEKNLDILEAAIVKYTVDVLAEFTITSDATNWKPTKLYALGKKPGHSTLGLYEKTTVNERDRYTSVYKPSQKNLLLAFIHNVHTYNYYGRDQTYKMHKQSIELKTDKTLKELKEQVSVELAIMEL